MDSMELPPNTAYISPFKGFWIRVVAFVLDSIIIGIFGGFALGFLAVAGETLVQPGSGFLIFISGWIGVLIGLILYKPLMEASEYQGTFGKYILGMKVINHYGERITTTASFVRSAIFLLQTAIPILNFVSWVALVMIGFTEYKQGLHDIASGTFVVPHQWQGPVPVEDQFGA